MNLTENQALVLAMLVSMRNGSMLGLTRNGQSGYSSLIEVASLSPEQRTEAADSLVQLGFADRHAEPHMAGERRTTFRASDSGLAYWRDTHPEQPTHDAPATP